MLKFISLLPKDLFNITGISRKTQSNSEINWLIGDISDVDFVESACKNQNIIIHAAAITHSFKNKPYFEINYHSTKKLIDCANEANVEKFIYISSRTAVAHSGGYGISKMKAEDYLKNNFDNWLIYRPSEIFGGSKNEGIDSLINDVSTKKIQLYPAGVKSKLFPIHVDDAVKLMFDFMNVNCKTIGINGNEGYTYLEFINKVSTLMGKNVIALPIPKFVMIVLKYTMETFNLKLGVTPDQIPRLYCIKPHNSNQLEIKNKLKNYISSL